MSYYSDRRDRDRGSGGSQFNPRRLYIGRIARYTEVHDLRHLFRRYGRIKDILFRDYYAFVEFEDVRDAEDACRGLNGYALDGERIIVQAARSRKETDHYDYYRSRRERSHSRSRDRRRSRSRDHDNDKRRRSGRDKCYDCGSTEHTNGECTNSHKNSDEHESKSHEGGCSVCRETGHRTRDCPKNKTSDESSSRKRKSRSRSPRGLRNVSPQKKHRLNESKSPDRSRASKRPHSPDPTDDTKNRRPRAQSPVPEKTRDRSQDSGHVKMS